MHVQQNYKYMYNKATNNYKYMYNKTTNNYKYMYNKTTNTCTTKQQIHVQPNYK